MNSIDRGNQIPIAGITTLVLVFFLGRILKSKKDPYNIKNNNNVTQPPLLQTWVKLKLSSYSQKILDHSA